MNKNDISHKYTATAQNIRKGKNTIHTRDINIWACDSQITRF